MTSMVYRPCLLVRWLAPRLPRAWQESIAGKSAVSSFAMGIDAVANKTSLIFRSAIVVVISLFALCLFLLLWGVPQATPVWLLGSLALAWWGYDELGLTRTSGAHRHWVVDQIAAAQGNRSTDEYVCDCADLRWRLDIVVLYGRPQVRSELEHIWLGSDTASVDPATQPRPRL
jgi:hypothetical protein